MRVDWTCAEQLGTIEQYRLTVTTTGRIALVEGASREIVGDRTRMHELYVVGSWMAEATWLRDDKLLVILVPRNGNASLLELVFQGSIVDELVIAACGRQVEAQTFRGVSSITMDTGVIHAECEGSSYRPPQQSNTTQTAAPTTATAVSDSHVEERIRELEGQVANLQAQLQSERDTNAAAVATLQDQLQRERRHASSLQGLATTNLSQVLASVQEQREELDATLAEKIDAIGEAEHDIASIETRIAEAESRLASLNQQREELASIEEVRSLDCEQASSEMEELRSRFNDNSMTAELMQTDQFLRGNSVVKTLKRISKELDSVEHRIGLIIIYRETFNNAVIQAMATSDGTLPFDRDLERGYDGDDDESETQD